MFSSSKKKRKISWSFSAFQEKENDDKCPMDPKIHMIEEEVPQLAVQMNRSVAQFRKISLFPLNMNPIIESGRKSEMIPSTVLSQSIRKAAPIQQELKIEDMFRNLQKIQNAQANQLEQNQELLDYSLKSLQERMQQEIERLEQQLIEKEEFLRHKQSNLQYQQIQLPEERQSENVSPTGELTDQGTKQIRRAVLQMLGFQLENICYIPNLQYELWFLYPNLKIQLTMRLLIGIRKNVTIQRDSKEFEQRFIAFSQDIAHNNIQLQELRFQLLRKSTNHFNICLVLETNFKFCYQSFNQLKLTEMLNQVNAKYCMLEQIQLDLAYLENHWGCISLHKSNETLIYYGIRFFLGRFLKNLKQLSADQIKLFLQPRSIIVLRIQYKDLSLLISEYQDIKNVLSGLVPPKDMQLINGVEEKKSVDQTFLEEESFSEENCSEDTSALKEAKMVQILKQFSKKTRTASEAKSVVEEISQLSEL